MFPFLSLFLFVIFFLHVMCVCVCAVRCIVPVDDGRGFILFLTFITMRTNGWVKLCTNCRKSARNCLVLNTVLGESAQEGHANVPIMWLRLANRLGTDKELVRNRRRNLKLHRNVVPGAVLLDFMCAKNIAPNRDEAKDMCEKLFSYDLLHHVGFETFFEDSHKLFVLVVTETERITEAERTAASWSASMPPTLPPPPSSSDSKDSNDSNGPKKRRLSSRELMQQDNNSNANPLHSSTTNAVEMTENKTKSV